MKNHVCNIEFCKNLSNLLMDPFLQVRFNSINALINLIVAFSEYDIDLVFLFQTNLLFNITQLLKEYTDKNLICSQSEQEKIRKILKSVFDLLSLLVELYDEDKKYNKLDFSEIIKLTINLILNSSDSNNNNNDNTASFSYSEDIVLNSCLFLAEFLIVKPVFILNEEENNLNLSLNNFVKFAVNILSLSNSNSDKGNTLVKASFTVSLLYIFCVNKEKIENLEEKLKDIILIIIKELKDQNITEDIYDLNKMVQNYVNNLSVNFI